MARIEQELVAAKTELAAQEKSLKEQERKRNEIREQIVVVDTVCVAQFPVLMVVSQVMPLLSEVSAAQKLYEDTQRKIESYSR